MRICPNGHEIHDDSKYCPKCGKLTIEDYVKYCPKCGKERRGMKRFCSYCGSPFLKEYDITNNQVYKKRSSKTTKYPKSLIYIIPLCVILFLITGFLIYNEHLHETEEENKIALEQQLELERIKIEADMMKREKERKEEEERKRIEEEENSPAGRLYTIANKEYVWAYEYVERRGYYYDRDGMRRDGVEYGAYMFFIYPQTRTSGTLSYIEWHENYTRYSKCTAFYTITDDLLNATLSSYAGITSFMKAGESIALRIEKEGDFVTLTDLFYRNGVQCQFPQKRKEFSDQIKRIN